MHACELRVREVETWRFVVLSDQSKQHKCTHTLYSYICTKKTKHIPKERKKMCVSNRCPLTDDLIKLYQYFPQTTAAHAKTTRNLNEQFNRDLFFPQSSLKWENFGAMKLNIVNDGLEFSLEEILSLSFTIFLEFGLWCCLKTVRVEGIF